MMIVNVSSTRRGGKGFGLRAKELAGLAARAVRSRFRQIGSLPDVSGWRDLPSWTAENPAEREALGCLGLAEDERISLPPVVQSHARRGSILVAIRGDAVVAIGGDVARIERAVEASITPAAESMGLARFSAEEVRVEHVMSNERTYYVVPSMVICSRQGESIEEAILRAIRHSAANTAYGHPDRIERLIGISGLGNDLRVEGYAHPRRLHDVKREGLFLVMAVRFSLSGRLHGPLFLMDRPGLDRPSVVLADHQANNSMPDVA